MRGKALSFLISLALTSWIAVPLQAAEVWRGPSSLEVRVEDSAGKAVEGAKVRLLYQAVEPKTGPAIASTDVEGEAFFFSLAEGWWALEVKKEGALSIHSEFVLSGEKKPAVLSTFQENTPGATQTLQVRIGRPRAGRAAGDPTRGPQVGKPAAAPAAPAPAQPASPVVQPSVPAAPVAAPEVKKAPGEEKAAAVASEPPAVAISPAPAAPPASAAPDTPSAPPAPTPPARPTSAPTVAPGPSPAPAPTPAPVDAPPPVPTAPVPSPPTPSPAPTVSVPPIPAPAPAPAAPTPAAVPAPATPAPPAPALPEPKAQRRSYAERSCIECKAGEESLSVEVAVPPGGTPCGEGLEARLRERDPAKAEAGLPPSCRLLRIVLPPEARFTGYRFEVEDGGASRDCRAGADCPVGTCRFPLDPGIRTGPAGTAFTAAFENTSPDRERRAIFTVYFAPE